MVVYKTLHTTPSQMRAKYETEREAIQKKTGFNVTKAIEINRESKEVDVVEETKKRRAAAPSTTVTEPQATGRRSAAPKYTIK